MSRARFKAPFVTTRDLIQYQFLQYNPTYAEEKAKRDKELLHMETTLEDLEKQGMELTASRQHYLEAKWFEEYTAHFPFFDWLKTIFENSLEDKGQPKKMQQAPDGSWGRHLRLFFLKFDQTVDALNALSSKTPPVSPRYPLAFLSRLNSPQVRDRYLNRLLISDIANTGIYNREALNAVTSGLAQLCFKSRLKKYVREHTTGFALTDEYVHSYKAFLDWWQDKTTGYWGAWYKTDIGIVHTSDLSMTYHMIAYQKKDKNISIQHWPKILATTFAIKERPYPYGWLHNGAMNDHNNYDVAKIFKYGWHAMTQGQKTLARSDIQEMLTYCLTTSWDAKEGFKGDPTFYNSLSAAYYFGVSFLCTIGYFNPANRFWTHETFPAAKPLGKNILAKMAELDLDDRIAEAARHKLRGQGIVS